MNIHRYMKCRQAAKNKNKTVADEFKWRDRRGGYHYPSAMNTDHLFYTVRMIWNHNMPVKLAPYAKYAFNEFYSAEYMKNALRAMVPELAKRIDLTNLQRADLKSMTRWLSTVQIAEREKTQLEDKDSEAVMVLK